MDKETKKCPFCGKEILATAKKCKHCKQFLPSNNENSTETTTKKCPFCGEEILATAKKCKHCKQFLEEDENQVKSDMDNTNQIQSFNNTSKKGIISVVLGIIIFCIISNSYSNSFLKGCELENERNINSLYGPIGTTETYYCKNNSLYDKVYIDYRNGNNYPDYSFIANDNKAARYYRKDGEYYCSLYNKKDDIAACDERKMLKLIKENINKINNEVETDRIKEKIKTAISGFKKMNEDYMDYERPKNPNCKDLITRKMNKNGYDITDTNGCQIKYENDVIVSMSADGQSATIYDSDNPKYYVNIKYNYKCELMDNWGYCIGSRSTIDYTGEQIPANNYIKNYDRVKLLSKDEINDINPRLHAYF